MQILQSKNQPYLTHSRLGLNYCNKLCFDQRPETCKVSVFFIFRLGAYWLRQVLDFAVLFHQAVFPMLSGQAYCVVNRFFFTWIRGVMLDFDFKVSCTPESLTQQCHAHHRVWLCSVRPSDMTPRKVMHTAVSICTKPE